MPLVRKTARANGRTAPIVAHKFKPRSKDAWRLIGQPLPFGK